MARFHDIDSGIWEDLLDYPSRQKLLYTYLCTCAACRPSGLYKITAKTIKHHTDATESDIKSISGELIEYDFDTQEVFVRGKLKRILSGFKNNEKMRLAVKHDFENLSSDILKSLFIKKYEGALEGLVSPPLPLPLPLPLYLNNKGDTGEKETTKKGQDKQKDIPESLQAVKKYFIELKNPLEAEKFFDFYSAKGWLVGRSPMKDWRAAARNWCRNTKNFETKEQKHESGVERVRRIAQEARRSEGIHEHI